MRAREGAELNNHQSMRASSRQSGKLRVLTDTMLLKRYLRLKSGNGKIKPTRSAPGIHLKLRVHFWLELRTGFHPQWFVSFQSVNRGRED